jgi:hypothetical protein
MKQIATTAADVGRFLEDQARKGEPVTYGQVLDQFPDLPEMNGAWLSHPLCEIFGQLDAQDHAADRPFRTALVYARDLSVPGQGFFDTLGGYRKKKIDKGQQLAVWVAELDAVKAHYKI